MTGERYRVVREGGEFGPFTVKELRRLVSMGTLLGSDGVKGEHGSPPRMLSDVVDTVPYLPVTTRRAPVIRLGMEPEEETEQDSYYYPPFSGLDWSAVAAALCGILAVVASWPGLSLFTPACVLLVVGFLLAVRSCAMNAHARAVLVPLLSLWMVFMFHADRVDWVPFQGKTGRTARMESGRDAASRPLFYFGKPSQAEAAETTKPAEAAIPESSVVWVEYQSAP